MGKKINNLEKENRLLEEKLAALRSQPNKVAETVAPAELVAANAKLVEESERASQLEKRVAEECKKRKQAEVEITFWKEKALAAEKLRGGDTDDVIDLKLRLKKETKEKKKLVEEVISLKEQLRESGKARKGSGSIRTPKAPA